MQKKYLTRLILATILLLSVFQTTHIIAQKPSKVSTNKGTIEMATMAYNEKNYSEAIKLYEQGLEGANQILTNENKAACYYNMGNCYYRMKDIPHAILCYERALYFSPADRDASFNLELAQSKLVDKFNAPAEMFFITWGRSLVQSASYTAWGHRALATLLITAFLILLYFWGKQLWIRKIGFFGGIFFILLTVLLHLFAAIQRHRFETDSRMVTMQTITLYTSPSRSADKFRTLHEGVTLQVLDTYPGNWQQVQLPDGTSAWMQIFLGATSTIRQ